MNFNGVVMVQPRRPNWWRTQPDVSVNPAGSSLLPSVIDAAEHLAAGQTLAFELDYEPALLYRILEQRGFDHWAEPIGDGRWRIDVRPQPGSVR